MGGVAVLDIGKTHIKVLAFDETGAVVAERSRPNAPLPPDPYLRLDTEGAWAFLIEGLREIAQVTPVDRLSITTHGASGVLVDAHGPVAAPMDYEGELYDAAYDALRPPFAETGSPALPRGLNLGRQLFHLMQASGARRARAFLAYPQYWAWRLSGIMASEVTSLGCHTDLWSPGAADFSSLVDRMGWRGLFPPLRRAWEPLGRLRSEIAALTGLSAETLVLCGAHDTNAAIAPYLAARTKPFTLVSTGTWVVVMAVGGRGALDEGADMLANVDVRGDAVPCARFMGGREFAALAGDDPPEPRCDDVAALVAAGVFALPAFSDQGGPFAARKGRIEGPAPEGPRAKAALATLYAALMTAHLIERLEAPGEIVVEGAFARHGAFAGALAALLPHRNVVVAASASGAAEGAARIARWGEPSKPPRGTPAPVWSIPGLDDYTNLWIASLNPA